jgi:AraC-like DNA-binding protein
MNTPFLYTWQGNKRLPVSFLTQQVSGSQYKNGYLNGNSFSATGDFGKVQWDEFQTSMGLYRIIRVLLYSEIHFSISGNAETISFDFCMHGFFRYLQGNAAPAPLAKYLGKLHFEESKLPFSYSVGPTGNQEYVLFQIAAPILQWQDLGFDGRMKEYMRNLFGNQNDIRLTGKVFATSFELQKWVMFAQKELAKPHPDSVRLNGLLRLILLDASGAANKQFFEPAGGKSWDQEAYIASQLAENMIMGMDESWSIQKLADAARLSQTKLKKIFKKHIGMPAMAFQISVRMEKARQLLMYSPMMIREISVRVGYSDPAHFSLVFKRKMGVSPSTLRKRKTM